MESKHQGPTTLNPVCVLRANKLMDITMLASCAASVEDNLKRRIRRITHLDDLNQETRHELVRASRMLYELSIIQSDGTRVLSSLDREEADIILNFPDHWSIIRLKNMVGSFFLEIRESGPVSPIEADLMSKDFVDMMES